MNAMVKILLAVVSLLAAPAGPVFGDEGGPQLAYVKFKCHGDIVAAHAHAMKVLKEAGYRVPAGQDDNASVAYGTLPLDSIAPVLMAHVLCSIVKTGAKEFTNVTIVTSSIEPAKAKAERDKLHDLMKNGEKEVAGTVVQGELASVTKADGKAGTPLVYATDFHITYAGKMDNALKTTHRMLDEMDFNPAALDLSHPPEVVAGSKLPDNIAALAVVTSVEDGGQIPVHLYLAVRYWAAKDASHNDLVKAKNVAKTVAYQYLMDMIHIEGGDPGNSLKPTHPK